MKIDRIFKLVSFIVIVLTACIGTSCLKNDEISAIPENNDPVVDADSVVVDSVIVDSVMVDTMVIDSLPDTNDYFEDCDLVVRDFTPEVLDYDFYIEGEVADKMLRYPQINDDWINTSNKYFIDYQGTWLQAYSDAENRDGHWEIIIIDVDITNIPFPYQLKESEGHVRWQDNRIDQAIENTDYCQGVDSGCSFFLSASNPNNTIIINNVSDQIIEGEFYGKTILKRTGFIPGSDSTICYAISNGKFRINYRTE